MYKGNSRFLFFPLPFPRSYTACSLVFSFFLSQHLPPFNIPYNYSSLCLLFPVSFPCWNISFRKARIFYFLHWWVPGVPICLDVLGTLYLLNEWMNDWNSAFWKTILSFFFFSPFCWNLQTSSWTCVGSEELSDGVRMLYLCLPRVETLFFGTYITLKND